MSTTKTQLLALLAAAASRHAAAQTEAQRTRSSLHRAVLAAVDGGCSLAEIGAVMGIDRQSVRWHITKAHETKEQNGRQMDDRNPHSRHAH